jgi:hypothetical protein
MTINCIGKTYAALLFTVELGVITKKKIDQDASKKIITDFEISFSKQIVKACRSNYYQASFEQNGFR